MDERLVELFEANEPQEVVGAVAALCAPHARQPQPELYVGTDVQPREQCRFLEYNDAVAAGAGDFLSGHEHLARGGLSEPGNHAQQRGLAAAGRAEQAHELARSYGEVDVAQGERVLAAGLEAFGDAAYFERRSGGGGLVRSTIFTPRPVPSLLRGRRGVYIPGGRQMGSRWSRVPTTAQRRSELRQRRVRRLEGAGLAGRSAPGGSTQSPCRCVCHDFVV